MSNGRKASNKKPGVCYAISDDGVELPVIDVTHPAFSIEITQEEFDRRLRSHLREVAQRARSPAFLQSLVVRFMTKRSRLMRALMTAEGGFLGGLDTYMLKLGPGNLHAPYASSIDRMISGSVPGLSVRLRLQNISHLLADGVCPMVARGPGQALHLLNIGGGPAIDSMNALIILQRQHSHLLAGRPIFIHILDLDEAGPHFGARALAALQSCGGPLSGLQISLDHTRYDWSDPSALDELLRSLDGRGFIAASSEGALFEYGSEEVIRANLQTIHAGTPSDAVMVGSVARDDATGRLLNTASRAVLQMRSLEAFVALVGSAGWSVATHIERPSGYDVRLTKCS